MKRIRMIKALSSPVRDLPEGVVLVVGTTIGTETAGMLLADGYAVEEGDEFATVQPPETAVSRPRRRKGAG